MPLAAVCRRFYGLVGRVHYLRLVETSRLRDHQVILECFHPSEKLSTPSLSCEYLGTEGLTEAGDDADLGELNNLYARFRPYSGDESYGPRRRQMESAYGGPVDLINQVPSHEVLLDSDEVFSQLCTVTNLVKVGPRRGLFSSFVTVTDSVIRVWRDWLAREAANAVGAQQRASSGVDDPSICGPILRRLLA